MNVVWPYHHRRQIRRTAVPTRRRNWGAAAIRRGWYKSLNVSHRSYSVVDTLVPRTHRPEQGNLTCSRLVPTEPLRIRAGHRPFGTMCEQAAYRRSDPVLRVLLGDNTSFGSLHNLGIAPDIAGDDWRAACHGFQQDVGPTFAAGGQHESIRRTVQHRQFGMRPCTQQPDTVRQPKPFDQRGETAA